MAGQIIIGYDPAHDGADAVRLGRVFADILAAKPLVVAALPWPSYLMGVEALQEQINREMAEDFAVVRKQLSGLDVETRAIATPSVAGTLHQLAESEPVELIVLGSSHRGPVGRTLAGSVGESLLHGAPCAIAVAPRAYGERDSDQLLQIGVAYDGSPESSTALETAIGIAERCHGRITVLVVADYPHYGYETTWSVLTAGEIRDAEHEEKQRLLACGGCASARRTRRRQSGPRRRRRPAAEPGEQRFRSPRLRIAQLRPSPPDDPRQHDAEVDSLVRLPGAGAPPRGRRRSVRAADQLSRGVACS